MDYYLTHVHKLARSEDSNLSPWYVPFIVFGAIFCISVAIWKILRTRWLHTVVVSFCNATLSLIIMRKIDPHDCNYEMDVLSIIEATIFIVALLSAMILLHYDGCKANKRNQCCMCCRIKKDLNSPSLYADRMFENDDSDLI